MINIRNTLIGLCVAAASLSVLAQNTDEHKEIHSEQIAPLAATVKMETDKAMNANKMAAMDQQIVDMHAMHEKMVAAKTPEERKTLMAQHMKLMQGGMTMMKSMCDMADMQGGAGMKGSMVEKQQMMDKCMAMMKKCMGMMETMMQMMMEGPPSVPAK